MYKNDVGEQMHRTQIYFDEALFAQIKKAAAARGETISAWIRHAVTNELRRTRKRVDFQSVKGIWKDRDIDLERLRKEAWR
jgi:hypothetical protein